MLRSLLLASSLTFGLAFGASAQVVTNGGYATTYPVGVPAPLANTATTFGIPSVPAINTPIAHVGPTTEQAPEPQGNLSPALPIVAGGPAVNSVAQPAASSPQTGLNLGAASYSLNPFTGPGTGTNGESLGEIARQNKQTTQNVNAKTYTNADIDKLQGNTYGGAAVNAANDNWPANNGVITQQPANNQPAIAGPAQNQSTTGTAPVTSPFAPRPQIDGTTTPQPQSMNEKPSPNHPVEMAQNNPANAGIPQNAGQAAPADNASSNAADSSSNGKTLPKTATRLPLLGVLGFFSVSMGLFVRYQRNKASR